MEPYSEFQEQEKTKQFKEATKIFKSFSLVMRFGCTVSMIFWLAFQAGLVYWIWRRP